MSGAPSSLPDLFWILLTAAVAIIFYFVKEWLDAQKDKRKLMHDEIAVMRGRIDIVEKERLLFVQRPELDAHRAAIQKDFESMRNNEIVRLHDLIREETKAFSNQITSMGNSLRSSFKEEMQIFREDIKDRLNSKNGG